MKKVVGIGSGAMMYEYILGFIKIGSAIQKLIGASGLKIKMRLDYLTLSKT
jgi:hypothetical protein